MATLFYSFEFSDIQKLLFSKEWTSIDEQAQVSFLEKNQDLSQLTDEQLRAAFKRYVPKSDWERFFNDKIPELNVEELIEEIRKSRNNIAHCKFFYKAEYDSCNKAISCLNKAIISAIRIAENKDFLDKNKEYISNTMAGVVERIGEFAQIVSDAVRPALQVMGRIADTVGRCFEHFQKYDFSGPMKALELLSTAAISPYSVDSIDEISEAESEDEDNKDRES